MRPVENIRESDIFVANQALSVAIVNYRTPDMTIRCVHSLIEQRICSPEKIVVLDNCSPDDSFKILQKALPECDVIKSSENRGYGDGVNIAVRRASTEYVMCLNPDTYFDNDRALKSIDILDNISNIGIVGLDLHYPDGERQYSARKFYSYLDILLRRSPLGKLSVAQGRVDRHLMKSAWDGGMFDADWVIGTGFIIRKSAFEAVGGMDVDFFMYMEDVDLCLRFHKAGWRVVAVPGMTLVHDHQRASASGLLSKAVKRHLYALNVYRRKHGIKWF